MIRKEWETILPNVVFSVGNDKRVCFWKDIWCSKEALCASSPSLFALAANKEAIAAYVWDVSMKEEG